MARKKTKPKRSFRITPGPLPLDAIRKRFDPSPLQQYHERLKRLQGGPLVDIDPGKYIAAGRVWWKDQKFPARPHDGDESGIWDALQQHVIPQKSCPVSLRTPKSNERQLIIRSTRPAPSLDHFPFMDLPPELRRMILQFTLQESKSIGIRSQKSSSLNPALRSPFRFPSTTSAFAGLRWNTTSHRWTRIPSNMIPSLTRVSKQIRSESAPIVYGEHVFSFRWMDDCHLFLHHIGKEMRSCLRRLYLDDFHPVHARHVFPLLIDARDLQSLEFGPHAVLTLVRCVYLTGDELVARWLAQAAKPLLQAMRAKRDADPCYCRGNRRTTDPSRLIRFTKRSRCENCARGMERRACMRSLKGFMVGMRNTCVEEEVQVRLVELVVQVAILRIMRERVDVGMD
ncbi:hypothetical protein NU219Hw_g8502t1 [Hortaea werneckii]